jgi:hypothetical protein
MDPLAEQERMQHARIVKFQKLWRSKRVFSNSQGSWKVSPSTLTAKIVTFKLPTNFLSVFQSAPKGFSEIMGYKTTFKKPVVRWDNGRWIGDAEGVNKIVAKKGQQTIVFTENYFDVMGLGNYEEAILAIVRNGWAPKFLASAPPIYKKIDGIFYVNKPFILEDLKDELTKLPATMRESVRYTPEASVPAVVLKLKNPKWTYQFFKNGTVLFTGIKDPSEREAPKQLFKEFFTKYDVVPFLAFNMGASPAIKKPTKGGNANAKKAKLANRYPLASSWNAKPPHGFYVRPGTNGKPRLYKWRKMEKELQSGETVNRGAMGLAKKNAVMVAKAYANVGVNVPAHTRKIFRNLGIPIEEAPARQATPAASHKNRRAPSWNATKEGYYVRPGPGKQPYWFAIPAGIASGRKTVIKTYTEAGRNIPAAVRAIFKIPANVKTNVVTFGNEAFKPGLQHLVTMGLNRILRINNRQATRLTKAELLGVARNMGIAEANAKMTPTNLVGLIQNKAGVYKPIRNANMVVNGMYYRLMNNGRVEKTTSQGIQTRRAWATLPADEQNKIAKALLPSNLHTEFNATAKTNKFNTLRAYVAGKKPVVTKAPSPPRKATPSPSSAGSNNNNMEALEFEYAARLGSNLGNMSRTGNEGLFMKIYGKLPVGARGKPLKANINRAYKKFVKETRANRANEAPKARYTGRIQVPNWMPANKVQAYKNLVTRLAFQKPKPAQKNMKEAIRGWINREVPLSPARAAREVENAVTGEKRVIPAYVPKPRKTPNIPKRTPPAKKSPKPKKYNASKSPRLQKNYALPINRTAIQNLNNAIANLGLPTGAKNKYTWSGLARAGLNAKFRNNWLKYVAVN